MAAAIIFMIAAPVHAVTYEYDQLNRLTKVIYENGTLIEYTYDAAGNMLTSETIPGLIVNEVKEEEGIVSGEAVAGSVIKVLTDGQEIGETTAEQDRTFSIALENLKHGQILIVQALREGQAFAEVTVTVGGEGNSTVPTPPKVGTVDDDSSNLVGTGKPGTTVKVYLDGEVIAEAVVDENGEFTIELPESVQVEAGKELELVAVDNEGIESPPTKVTVISKEERSQNIPAESVAVTNNQTLIDDEIIVNNLTAGDIVTVYRTKTGTEMLAKASVPEGQDSVTIQIEELGKGAGSIYVSLTSSGMKESLLTEITYDKEPGGTDGCVVSHIAYGTKLSFVIPILQNFRDNVLMPTPIGQDLVKTYYNFSAKTISKH